MTKPRSHRISDHALVIVATLLWQLLAGTATAGFPPVITAQPTNFTTLAGADATFQVKASSVTTLTYQWYFQTNAIPGATNRLFTRTDAQLVDAGPYYVAVTNADGGLISSNAVLTVLPATDVSTTVSGPVSVLATSNLTYTITVTNRGLLPATNVVVRDSLPTGVDVVGFSGGGTIVGSGAGQVQFDTASDNQNSGTLSWPHTTTEATNRLLLVGISLGNGGIASDTAVTSVSYGGSNLTQVIAKRNGTVTSELWQLVNPPSGSNTVTLEVVDAPTMLVAGGATFSGVDQLVPLSASNSAMGTGTLTSLTVNSATNEQVLDILTTAREGVPIFDSNQTTLWENGANGTAGGASTKIGASLVTMLSGIDDGPWVDIAASVKAQGLAGEITWEIPYLAGGAATNFTVTITAPAGGALTNIVSSTSASMDSNAGNNDGSALSGRVVTSILPVADLATTQIGPASVPALTNFTYTVAVSNAGPSAASGVVVREVLDPTLTYVSASSGGVYLGGVVTWPAVDNLARNATTNFTVTVRAPTRGIMTNFVSSTSSSCDPSPGNDDGSSPQARVVTSVGPLAIDSSSKWASSTSTLNWNHNVGAGDSRILIVGVSIDDPYTSVLAVTFGGILPMTPVGEINGMKTRVSMYQLLNPPVGKFPISVTLNSPAGVVGGAMSLAGIDQSNPIMEFAGNTGNSTNAVVTIASALGGVVINAIAAKSPQTSIVSGNEQWVEWNFAGANYAGAGGSSPGAPTLSPSWTLGTATNWAMAAVALKSTAALADVGLKVAGPANIIATSNLTYSVTVTNYGLATATNVVVNDALPPGTIFVSATAGGTYNAGVVKWPVLSRLNPQAGTNYLMTVRSPVIGMFTNIAYANATTTDPDPSNNNGAGAKNRVTTQVIPLADLVTTVAGPASVLATTNFSYTVTLSNVGPSPASDMIVTDSMPSGTTFVSASNGGTFDAGTVSWTLAGLAVGETTNLTMTLIAPADGRLTNVVVSTSTTADPEPGNNDGTASAARVITSVTPIADIAVGMAGPAGVVTNATFNYLITLTNSGPSTSGDVLVTDKLPSDLTFVSATGGGTHTDGTVTWSISSLPKDATTNLTLSVWAKQIGHFSNTVFSASPVIDPNLLNNDGSSVTATVSTEVYPFLLLSGYQLQSGAFRFEFHTYPDTVVSVEASTNLQDWIELTNSNSGDGYVIFIDPDGGGFPQRFYRIQQ